MAALSTIAAGVAIAGTAASYVEGRKARKASAAANAAQRESNRLRNFQARRQFLRGFRQAQGQALAGAIAAGIGIESSATQGTLASERSQRDTALREFKEFNRLGDVYTAQINRATNAQFRAGAYGSLGSFAGNFVDWSNPFGFSDDDGEE